MANHKSALKKHRQSIVDRQRNREHRSRMRTAIKKLRAALEAGEVEGAKELLNPTLSLIDHTAKLGACHDNSAARTKSRLTKAYNRLGAAG